MDPFSVLAMEPPLVAELLTTCGPLQFYSNQALRELVHTLPNSCCISGDRGAMASGASLTSNSLQRGVIEGWDVDQWCKWGRKKSALASNICKLNGTLKTRIADLEILTNGSSATGAPCVDHLQGASVYAILGLSLLVP